MRKTRRDFLQLAGAGAAASLGIGGVRAAERGGPKRQIPFRLGLASYTLRKFPLDEALAMTGRVGLDTICLKAFHLPMDATPEQIAKAAGQCKAAGINLYGGGVIKMSKPEQVDQAFEYAKAAGMSTIVGVPAPEVLKLVEAKVKQYDIKVAIHNHGPGDDVYPTPASAYEKIKNLDGRIGLCIDVGHTLRIGADPVLDIRRFADRVLDMHIKDVSAASKEGKTLEIGRGVLDIPGVLAALIETEYSRIVSFEYEKDAEDPLAGLAESVGYVRGVLAVI